jgi:virulence-associated protein VapD
VYGFKWYQGEKYLGDAPRNSVLAGMQHTDIDTGMTQFKSKYSTVQRSA